MSLLKDVKKKATKEIKKQSKHKGSKHKGNNKIEKIAKKELKKRFKI
jgi:hypothetical protein